MSVEGTLDDRYFEWLYKLVGTVRNRNPERSHWELLRKLYTTQFTWFIRNDDNRVVDGKDLRFEFIDDERLDQVDRDWLELDCSFLEMLIALARRAAFESSGSPAEWFWHLMNNIGLKEYTDAIYNRVVEREVERTLNLVVNRRYTYFSIGGLFPVSEDHGDQRNTELWYQMANYLLEKPYITERGPFGLL